MSDPYDYDDLISEIETQGGTISHCGRKATCVWHDDTNPSASILEDDDGHYRIHCHCCDKTMDVIDLEADRTGASVPDILRRNATGDDTATLNTQTYNEVKKEKKPSKPKKLPKSYSTFEEAESAAKWGANKKFEESGESVQATKIHAYPDSKGNPYTWAIRFESETDKTFNSITVYKDEYYLKAVKSNRPLYNLDTVQQVSSAIVVVEGETNVDALDKIGIIATTSQGGSSAPSKTDWTPIAGREIIILPDNDEPGTKYAKKVRELVGRAVIVDPEEYGFGKGGDIADVIKAILETGTEEDAYKAVMAIIKTAAPKDDLDDLKDHIKKYQSGKIKEMPTPFPQFDKAMFGDVGLDEGGVCVIGGSPGVGKSYWTLGLMIHWQELGIDCRAMYLESARRLCTSRLAAIASCNDEFTGLKSFEDISDALLVDMIEEVRPVVAPIMERITTRIKDEIPRQDYVLKWVQQSFDDGADVVIIDPVTLVQGNEGESIADKDRRFMAALTGIAEATDKRILLITHLTKGAKRGGGQGSLSGGAAYSENSTSNAILLAEEGEGDVMTNTGMEYLKWDRVFTPSKGRNSKGRRGDIAMTFDPVTLTFKELGQIVSEKKETK